MQLERYENETDFEWKLRLCLAKKNELIDIKWSEIIDILGLDISTSQLRKQAVGYYEYDNYIKGLDDSYTCVLSISDLHIPFELPLTIFEPYAGKVQVLQINGDFLDCTQLSKFTKTYRLSPVEEIIKGRNYLIDLIRLIKPKKVLINHGNHEIRQGRYLAEKLDNEIQELMPSNSLEYIINDGFTYYNRFTMEKSTYSPIKDVFPEIDIEYSGNWYSTYGDIIFCHPSAFSSSPLKTAEKALYWFRNEGFDFRAIVMAHTHRVGEYKIGNSMIYEQGCLCDLTRMDYAQGKLVNSQKQGFGLFFLDKDNKIVESKTKIVKLN